MAYRPGTRANQQSAALLYIAFTLFFALQDFPAVAGALLVFGEFLAGSMRSPKSVTNVLSALRTLHLEWGFDTGAFEQHRLWLFKRALPLTLRHRPCAAPPLPFELLERLCALADSLGAAGVVFTAFLATLFFTMARASSLLPRGVGSFDVTRLPTQGDLVARDGGFRLLLKWGKAAQDASQAFWVPLLPIDGSPACPVRRLRALSLAARSQRSETPLFLLPTPSGATSPVPLTLTLARTWLRACLARVGHPADAFTLHSFRRGACTLAFQMGAAITDIKELGGWRSDAVRLYYPALAARSRAAECLTKRLN